MAKYFIDYSKLDKKEREEYDKNLKRLILMMGLATLIFYVLPYIWLRMSSQKVGLAILMLSLVAVFPVFVFGCGMIDASKGGFGFVVPALLGLFYVPTSLILYGDAKMAILGVMYFVMGMFGELTGYLFQLRRKSKRQPLGLNRLAQSARKKEKNKSKRK